ncbi:phytoene desaturase family protein [Shewanella intestini]|uniref:NAD(P)/FAD-dependent oxidoreductase n=1 Tax=Shewanella intestini TaxID=2017544 RepID=A0ABS5I027_9GAMM|nr:MULTISPECIES: NAD(P)/FAD-dependent oxidoreductase [Shewanella]MBR9727034.1 NAD(P)/FAD-dependent oxidoreductase [Shewanella intestini]MRG35835.1 NAD(P)-binding protein [Shewanella sp. XMDDZSB0408]
MTTTDFDAIVIGAGNAGLTAATTLQRGGAKTLLLERHNIPGGCATSFVRGDFEFEVALHQLSGMGTEQAPFIMRQIFAELGIMDKLEVVVERDLYRFVMPSKNGGQHEIDITLPAHWKALAKTLVSHFPKEQTSIGKFMQLCEGLSMECFTVLPKAKRITDEHEFTKTCPLFTQFGLRNAKEVLDEFFDDKDLKAVVAAYWCYLGMPPKDFAFRDLAIMFYAYAAFKPCHVKGGSQAISSALLASFMDAGGEIRFNCGANKIITENQKVSAVVTEHGDIFSCKQVISNTSPLHTFNELLDIPTPKQAAQDMKSRRLGTSAFVLYIGLDCSPKDIGVTAASSFIVDDRDEDVAHQLMHTINPPKHTMLTCYNYDDPSFAPPGKSAISLLCLQYGAPWEALAPEDYARTKYELADHLINHAERVFPHIRQHIEEIEVATPLTMMRYLNTPGDAIYGFQQNTQDANLFRRRIDEIAGLHIAGCWNGMGGFQPTYMAGQATAKGVLKALSAQQSPHTTAKQELSHA